MVVQVYISSVTSSTAMKKQQQKIEMVLEGQRIPFELVDISLVDGSKEKMRSIIGNATAVPPQIFNDDVYCGNFEQFLEAIEDGLVKQFLKVAAPAEAHVEAPADAPVDTPAEEATTEQPAEAAEEGAPES